MDNLKHPVGGSSVSNQSGTLNKAINPVSRVSPVAQQEVLKEPGPSVRPLKPSLSRNFMADKWRFILSLLFVVVAASLILLPKLGSLIPATTQAEQPYTLNISVKENLIEYPFFLPERAIQAALLYTSNGSGTYLRLVSVIFAVISLVLMYWLLSIWYTRRVALLSILMLGTSGLFLHQARWAEPEVMYLTVIPTILVGTILLKKKRYDHLWPLTIFALTMLLYLPGAWVLVTFFLLLNYKKIHKTFKYLSNSLRFTSLLALIIPLLPLSYSFWKSPWLLTTWVGLPEQGLNAQAVLRNLYEIPKQLFVTGPDDPLRWLSGTPVLDAITIALTVIGIYSFRSGLYPLRWRVLGMLSLVSIVLISLGGPVSLSLLLPLVYIFAGNGLALLLQQWFTIFPRNPFARGVGISAVVILVLVACSYQLTRYYIAWPHAPATYQAIKAASE